MINLISFVFNQGGVFSFGNFLNELEGMGFFQYILPFLLIFALVYALLLQIPVFQDKKGAVAIIAAAIGLMSLQLGIIPAFFQQLMPNLGIGLGILLAGLILAGVFLTGGTDTGAYKWVFFSLGALIFIIVILVSLSGWSYGGSSFGRWQEYRGILIVIIVLAAAVFAIMKSSSSPGNAKV